MSIDQLQLRGTKSHEFRHDLESFLYVYLYHCVRFQMRALSENDQLTLLRNIHAVFDYAVLDADDQTTGGDEKKAFLQPSAAKFSSTYLSRILCPSAVSFISKLRVLFVPLYADRPTVPDIYDVKLPSIENTQDVLKSSKPLTEIFFLINQHDWVDDKSDCLFGKPPVDYKKKSKQGTKRKHRPASANDGSTRSSHETKKSRVSNIFVSDVSASTLVWDDVVEELDVFSS